MWSRDRIASLTADQTLWLIRFKVNRALVLRGAIASSAKIMRQGKPAVMLLRTFLGAIRELVLKSMDEIDSEFEKGLV